jgi:ankyrin repeat protein
MEALLTHIGKNDLSNFSQVLEHQTSVVTFKLSDNSSLVHCICREADVEMLSVLLNHVSFNQESKFSSQENLQDWLNLANDDGNTAALFAAYVGSADMLKILAKFGSDLNFSNKLGKTPAHIAAEKDFPQILAILAGYGTRFDVFTCRFETPLHLAVLMNSFKCTALLLALGVKGNKKDFNGQTALHLAALNNNGRIARILMFKGCEKMVTDRQGFTAAQLASDKKVKELFEDLGILQIFGYRPMVKEGGKKNYVPSMTLCFLIVNFLIVDSVFVVNCEE